MPAGDGAVGPGAAGEAVLMTGRAETPRAVLVYGVLGIVPIWSLPVACLLAPTWMVVSAAIKAVYAALIISFLGGARWGLAVPDASPNPVVVGVAMTPTLAGFASLVFAHGEVCLQLLALAAALTLS